MKVFFEEGFCDDDYNGENCWHEMGETEPPDNPCVCHQFWTSSQIVIPEQYGYHVWIDEE